LIDGGTSAGDFSSAVVCFLEQAPPALCTRLLHKCRPLLLPPHFLFKAEQLERMLVTLQVDSLRAASLSSEVAGVVSDLQMALALSVA
jgi:hypothetical protein